MKEDIRYLARWVFAARPGDMRIQVFGAEGTFLADMRIKQDSVSVMLPQEMEYHRGLQDNVPLGALLGLEIEWQSGLRVLNVLLWPAQTSHTWIPGTLGRRGGWYRERGSVFMQIDANRGVPDYVHAGTERDILVAEVDSFLLYEGHHIPERVSFEWPGHDARMWLEIISQSTTEVDDDALAVPCSEAAVIYDW